MPCSPSSAARSRTWWAWSVEAAERKQRGVDRTPDGNRVRDVGADTGDAIRIVRDGFEIGDDDACTVTGEPLGDGLPDPASTAGDERDASGVSLQLREALQL